MVSQHAPKSEEECRAAHNASSRRSYQKSVKTVPEYGLLIKTLRHWLDINKCRRDTYQAVAKKAKKKSKG